MVHVSRLLCIRILACFCSLYRVETLVILDNVSEQKPQCCIRDEWEGNVFLDYGTVFIDQNTLMTYFNGSMHVAYSVEQKKFYYDMHVVELSPLIPKPIGENTTVLRDYNMGMSYTVTNGKCQVEPIDKSMPRQCIPADATLLSKGVFGDQKRPVETYQFTTDNAGLELQVTATILKGDQVEHRYCEPFYATYFTPSVNPDSGTTYSLNVMDIGPLKSKDIFDIPSACTHINV